MRFLIIGAGEVGLGIATRLCSSRHDVVLIDQKEDVLTRLPASLDLQPVLGNGASPQVLGNAGLAEADYVIAVTNSDETNIATALISKLINPSARRILRIRTLNLQNHAAINGKLDEYFDLIINPDQAGADHLFDLFRIPGAVEVSEFAGGRLRLLGLEVTSDAPIDGKKIASFQELRTTHPFVLVAILRGQKLIVPRGSDRIHAGDLIYTIASHERTDLLLELAGKVERQPDNAIIWGGSATGRYLANAIASTGASAKLILEQASTVLDTLEPRNNLLILEGDGTDQDLLVEENISACDAFIAVSPDEEENILAALLAKKLGARRVMTLVNRGTYQQLVSAIGVDVVVSAHQAAAATVIRHIHSKSLISEFILRQHQATFIELRVDAQQPLLGQRFEELNLPYGILIAALVRGGDVLIPTGKEQILFDDILIMFTIESALAKLQKIFNIKLEILP